MTKKVKLACYKSHPILSLGKGHVLGGSCLYPPAGYPIYLGLDYGMAMTVENYPWNSGGLVLFPIIDGSIPKNIPEFKNLITWLVNKLDAGLSVHIGCIGGHGRTGLVLSALVQTMLDEPDAIGYVRKEYCQKAVETREQINFLKKTFGCADAKPSRVPMHHQVLAYGKKSPALYDDLLPWDGKFETTDSTLSTGVDIIQPIKNKLNIWGANLAYLEV